MAKKAAKNAEPAVEAEVAQDSTTYSTRFQPEQRKLIEDAAKELSWSPAKLIREASVTHAAEILNSTGSGPKPLRVLAGRVVSQLLNPTAQHKRYGPHLAGAKITEVSYLEGTDDRPDDLLEYDEVLPRRPHDSELRQIREALETSGGEFVKMIVEQWKSFRDGTSDYRPKVNARDLLQPDDKD